MCTKSDIEIFPPVEVKGINYNSTLLWKLPLLTIYPEEFNFLQVVAEIEDGQHKLEKIHLEMRNLQEDAHAMHEKAQAHESESSEKVAIAKRMTKDIEQREVTKHYHRCRRIRILFQNIKQCCSAHLLHCSCCCRFLLVHNCVLCISNFIPICKTQNCSIHHLHLLWVTTFIHPCTLFGFYLQVDEHSVYCSEHETVQL